MVRNKGKLYLLAERKETKKGKRENDLDALFRLPLAEFTTARNTLAAQLKKAGQGEESNHVKALVKPSISAWTVNQLYWNQREAFDRLIESGRRFHKAQSSRAAGKLADMRAALDDRREALATLTDLATSLLRDASHNPTSDTIRRITTTLEAMSAYSRPDGSRLGRLTHDVDPPGFDSFASLITGGGLTSLSQKSPTAAPNARHKVAADTEVRKLEATRDTKLAGVTAAKVSLQEAKRSLTEARARAQSLDATHKKADAEAKKAEKQRRDAEDKLDKAKAAFEDATRRVRSIAVELDNAARSVKFAQRTVEKAAEELDRLSRD